MGKHTPEPWDYGDCQNVTDANGKTVVADGIAFATGVPSEESKDVSRRIVACVNACAGIPTEQLEAGCVKRLVKALRRELDREARRYDKTPGASKFFRENNAETIAAVAPFQKESGQ